MDFYFESLKEETKKVFLLLNAQKFINQFYLAGGSGLALQINHRVSIDLDFFCQQNFDETILTQQLSPIGKFELQEKAPQSVIGFLNNVKISFLGYKYPLVKPLHKINNVNIADIYDIACMKIDAISSRGTKRDFIDIYFIAKEIIPLLDILKIFEKKYESVNYNMMHIKKSLVYFDDAGNDPLPQMLKPIEWNEVKNFFKRAIIQK